MEKKAKRAVRKFKVKMSFSERRVEENILHLGSSSFPSLPGRESPVLGPPAANPADSHSLRHRKASLGPAIEKSSITREDLDLIRVKYSIPEKFSLIVPGVTGRVITPPYNGAALYEETLEAGVRLPFHPFILDVLNLFRIAPTQIAPNGFRVILSFYVLCRLKHIEPRASLFGAIFCIKDHPYDKEWCYITPRPKCKFITGIPSSIHGWKNRYFYVTCQEESLDLRTFWQVCNKELKPLQDEDKEDFSKLVGMGDYRFQDLISHPMMSHIGPKALELDMASSEGRRSSLMSAMTQNAEKRKRTVRAGRKRKVEEITSPDLTPVAELEVSLEPQQLVQEVVPEVPAEKDLDTDQPSAPIARPEPVRPEVTEKVVEDSNRAIIYREYSISTAATRSSEVAVELMESIRLPADRAIAKEKSVQSILSDFGTSFCQVNAFFLELKDRFAGLQKESEEQLRKQEEKYNISLEEYKSRCASAEIEKVNADLKLESFMKESSVEFSILREELDLKDRLLRESESRLKTSEGYAARLGKEKDILEKRLVDAKASIIGEYKGSDQYKEDLANQFYPVYFDGFDDCRAEAAKKFPNLDFSQLQSSLGTRDELCPEDYEEGAGEEDKEATPDAPFPILGEAEEPEKDEPKEFTGEESTGDLTSIREMADQMADIYEKFGANFVIEMSEHTGLFIFAFGIGYNKCLTKVRQSFPEVDADFLILTDLDTRELLAEVMKGEPMVYIKTVLGCVNEIGRLTMGSIEEFEKEFARRLKSARKKKKSRKKRG